MPNPSQQPALGLSGPRLDFRQLPSDPGVYVFRDISGRALYVGKSVSIRRRARAHFAPSAPEAPWRRHAQIVDYQSTASELGALVLENRLIKRHAPPGNVALNGVPDGLVYIRCRLDVSFPILEVARDPAPGHAVSIGPLSGRRAAVELVEQINSLFGLRRCGRRMAHREFPSAYGQMGRCLSPCLGDLDPNLYRTRLDQALALFGGPGGQGVLLLEHVENQMRQAAAAQLYERAQALHRRLGRLRTLLNRLGSRIGAVHARSILLLAPHPVAARFEAFRIVNGRLTRWGDLPCDPGELARWLGAGAAMPAPNGIAFAGTHVPPEELDEVRIIGAWMAANPQAPTLTLRAGLEPEEVADFVGRSVAEHWPGGAGAARALAGRHG